MKSYKAKCMCGKVSFEVALSNVNVGLCHCNDCQRITSAHFANIHHNQAVAFDGEEYITVYKSSAWAERTFCNQCGSTLYYKYKDDPGYSFSAGLFEDKSDFILIKQLFIDKKPNYISIDNKTEDMTEAEIWEKYDIS